MYHEQLKPTQNNIADRSQTQHIHKKKHHCRLYIKYTQKTIPVLHMLNEKNAFGKCTRNIESTQESKPPPTWENAPPRTFNKLKKMIWILWGFCSLVAIIWLWQSAVCWILTIVSVKSMIVRRNGGWTGPSHLCRQIDACCQWSPKVWKSLQW